MLFKIDESCLSAIDRNDENAICALSSLALSRKYGHNVIFADRMVLENLINKNCFERPICNIFKKIFINSELKLYWKNINRYVVIVDEIKGDRLSIVEDKEEYKIALNELKSQTIFGKTILLTENIDDAKIYYIISKYYRNCNRINKFDTQFDEQMGGGGTIAKVLESISNKKENHCLCIVDSDKKFPEATCGDTMAKTQAFARNKEQHLWKLCCLDVHEIENLIPIKWIEKVTMDIPNIENCTNFINHLFEKKDESIYYFDMKEGIKSDKFICSNKDDPSAKKKYNKAENFRRYWRQHLDSYNINIDNVSGEYIIPGTCKKLLEKIIKEYGDEICFEEIEDHLKEKWLDIGITVFSWGCVGERIIS